MKKTLLLGTLGLFLLGACHSHSTDEHAGHDHEAETTDAHDHGHGGSNEIVLTPDKAKAAGVTVSEVQPGTFHRVIKTSGQVLAAQGDERVAVAPVSGVVNLRGRVIEGMRVGKGEALLTLSSNQMAEGDPVEKARVAYETAKKEYERMESLLPDRIVSEKDFARAREAYENALRLDPALLVPGARTVVSVALNYYPAATPPEGGFRLARYALGLDYHDVMRQRLRALLSAIGAEDCGRPCCDTAPVDERYWAVRCGLGWQGRNGQLIVPGAGSYFFLGELILTLPADRYDSPVAPRCGTCHRCIEACPTGAAHGARGQAYSIDEQKCISCSACYQACKFGAVIRK